MIVETQKGSATSAKPQPSAGSIAGWGVIIAHLCNHVGAWGKGFVLAVDQLSLIPRKAYKEMAQRHSKVMPLGETQFCEVEPNLWVANMVAQNGIDKAADPNGCLVDYKALDQCLKTTFERAVLLRCNVHIPSGMGSGLAGGSEKMIHAIVETRARHTPLVLLEQQLQFVPRVTLWEFDDASADSFVGKPTASKQALVASVFGKPDDTGEVEDLDEMMENL